jgi:hypothetical protein
MSEEEMQEAWLNVLKLNFTNTFISYKEASDKSQIVSDLVAGILVRKLNEKDLFLW